MSTYSLEKLLSLWKQEELSVEQMVGFMLQNLILLERRIALLEKGQPRAASSITMQEKERTLQSKGAV